MGETEDILREAQIIIDAHALGKYMENDENHPVIVARKAELLSKINSVNWMEMDLPTQAVMARGLHNVAHGPIVDVHTDLKTVFALGMIIGKELAIKDEHL